jgi:hypothetical protein
VFLVRLDVLSIFNATVLRVVNGKTGGDGTGTESLGNAQLVWKAVELKNRQEHHFDDHVWREVFE